MKKIVCYWMLGKAIDIVLCFIMLLTETITNDSISRYLSGKKLEGFTLFLIYVIELWVTEIWTGKFVFETQFLEIFKGPNITPADSLDNIRLAGALEERLVSEESGSAKLNSSCKLLRITKVEQLHLPVVAAADQNPQFQRQHGFGPVFLAMIDEVPVRVRRLALSEISTYQLREIPEELKKWKKVRVQSIETVLCEFHSEQEFYLVYEAREHSKSLEVLLRDSSRQPSDQQKVAVAKMIIKALVQLASLGDGYAHGHLSTSNVLVGVSHQVDRECRQITITDWGFLSLKTYSSMLADYGNKDRFTSPELLVVKGKAVKKPTHKADVYSLGFIL